MSDWLYDWLKDMTLPALAGVGGIVVGTGAMIAAFTSNKVAEQSLALAQQVRNDEQKREADAARERYRDQLFRTIEPAVTALLAHRTSLARSKDVNAMEGQLLTTDAQARLRLVQAIINEQDRPVLEAVVRAYRDAHARPEWEVLTAVTAILAIRLPLLLSDALNRDQLVLRLNALVEEQVARVTDDSTAPTTA